jgi:hypothetical protein
VLDLESTQPKLVAFSHRHNQLKSVYNNNFPAPPANAECSPRTLRTTPMAINFFLSVLTVLCDALKALATAMHVDVNALKRDGVC